MRSQKLRPTAAQAASPDAPALFDGRVIAIGASAGGLDALARFFKALPADTGAAYVVIQHLSPDHKSMMADLLGRHTAMPVVVAEQGMALAGNRVHLIPAGMMMRLAADRLQLAPKPEHGLTLPIDTFFGSLAEAFSERAIAVVLSGTGSDGSRGVQEINAAGGMFFVQDPASAKFDGMPVAASQAATYDGMGSPDDLAARLAELLAAPRDAATRALSPHAPAVALPLDTIHELLLASSGIDFRQYKPTTVLRRIERRMQVLHCPSLAGYRERLAAEPDELVLLRRELLIPVTRFFRDPEVFELLAEQVVPELVQRAGPEGVRAWVACCATGEEAYSMAMLFAEGFERAGKPCAVKIFATDVERQYLDHAAAGLYPETIAAELSPERLARFFVERNGRWQVRPELRQMVIFARHNVVADPPFTRMALASCRNALIYFEPAAQEAVLRRLQYALVPGGHLVLGPSESLGELHRDFQPLRQRVKVYRMLRRDRSAATLDLRGLRHSRLAETRRDGRLPLPLPRQADDAALALLTQDYVPPSVVVSESRQLLRVYGDSRQLLQFNEGQATLDLMKLLPRDLVPVASLLLQALAGEAKPQRSPPLRLPDGDGWRRVQLVARPLQADDDEGFAVLSLEALGEAGAPLPVPEAPDGRFLHRIEELERDLALMHDSLQATIEELETSNEELQATNEELMASNEELQSTNEELQSVNEELYTVNSEYQEKVDVLNSVNADLENVSKAAAIPTVFVDEDLRLTRFTPEATPLFNLRSGDEGRSIEDFAHRLDYPSLFADLRQTLARGVVCEREVRSRDGRWWLARIQPYAGRSAGASRAVMTFVGIDSVKDSQRLQAVVDSLPQHVAVVDACGTITLVNAAWSRFAAANGESPEHGCGPGSNYLRVCAQSALTDADARRAHDGLSDVLQGHLPIFQMHYPCHAPDCQRWFLMYAAPIAHAGGGAVVSHVDISDWVRRSGGVLPDGSRAAP